MIKYNYSLTWKTRSGGEATYTLFGDEGETLEHIILKCERLARDCGYPGHKGGWWRYLLADLGLY